MQGGDIAQGERDDAIAYRCIRASSPPAAPSACWGNTVTARLLYNTEADKLPLARWRHWLPSQPRGQDAAEVARPLLLAQRATTLPLCIQGKLRAAGRGWPFNGGAFPEMLHGWMADPEE